MSSNRILPAAFGLKTCSFYITLLVLLLPIFGLAQASTSVCDGWGIEVNAVPEDNILSQLGENPGDCLDATNGCGMLYYYVSLINTANPNDTIPVNFRFRSLSIGQHLSFTNDANVSGTNQIFSRLDTAAIETCSRGGFNDPGNIDAPQTAWSPDGYFYYHVPYTNNIHSWWVTGRRLLFVLVIRAYPGETAHVGIPSIDYTGVSGTAPNIETTFCSNTPVTMSPGLVKSLPTLNNCTSSNLKLRLGLPVPANIPGYPNSKRIAVGVVGSAPIYDVKNLEFSLEILENQSGLEMSLEAGLLSKPGEFNLFQQGTFSQIAHCSAQNFSIPGGTVIDSSNTLFYILILNSPLHSVCTSVTVSFTGLRRLELAAGSCCKPSVSVVGTLTISNNSTPCASFCQPQTSLKIKRLNNSPGSSCPNLQFALEMTNSSTFKLDYQSGEITLDLHHTDSLNFVSFVPQDFNMSTYPVSSTALSPDLLRLNLKFTAADTLSILPGKSKILGLFTVQGSDNTCIESIFFYDALYHRFAAAYDCAPVSVSTEIGPSSIPGATALCLQHIPVRFETQYATPAGPPAGSGIEEVSCKITTPDCTKTATSTISGVAEVCISCKPALNYLVRPTKTDNPLNGISTYDLVLISRHILGLEPLNNPYKIIAADVNKNMSITTFDIVELRKLILGIYQTLPQSDSWQFIDKSFVFTNPNNPFQSLIPGEFLIQDSSGLATFYGIKIGDVDGNVIPNSNLIGSTVDRAINTTALGYYLPTGRRGERQEIPLFVTQASDLAAWQMALHYDTAQIKITGVRWPEPADPQYEMSDWNTPKPGELRLCRLDRRGEASHLTAQSPIAYLQIERLRDSRQEGQKNILQVISSIPGEGYGNDGAVRAFELKRVMAYQAPPVPVKVIQPKPEWTVQAYPNPSSGLFRFEVSLPLGGEGRIGIYDPMGRLVAQQVVSFTPGLNVFTSQSFPTLDPGIYFVRFTSPLGRQTLRLVKN